MSNNRYSDNRILQAIVTMFLVFIFLCIFLKVLFF